jgi:predicted NBD/HSP70 family sugar kinase
MNLNHLKYNSSKKRVLRILFSGDEYTRGSLVETTGLSNLTIARMITEFIEDGTVIEEGSLASTGGRKPSTLKINPEFGYILSLDIGSYSVKIGIVKFNGEILDKEMIVCYKTAAPVRVITINDLQDKISVIFEKYGKNRFLGIGIGISGMVDYYNGKVVFCPNITGYDNLDVRDILCKKFALPVFLDTSARCMALAEQYFGCGRNSKNLMLLSLGYSIAAGIIINSQVFRGTSGFAGEIGHVQVEESQLLCTCGNYGCFELYATIPMIRKAIIKRLSEFSGYSPTRQLFPDIDSLSFDQIVQAYNAGDKIIEEEILKTAEMVGSVLAKSVNILNLDLIVLGGGLIELLPNISDEVSRATKKRCLVTVKNDLIIKSSTLGIDSPIKGAAVQVLHNLIFK